MKSKKLSVEWQMQRWGLTREEAEEKIKKIRASYGTSNVQSVEWQMQRWGLTREEAEEKIKKIRNKIKETQKKMSKFDFKAMSAKNPEHWIKKGYSEKEAIELSSQQIKDMQKAAYKSKLDNPEKYKNSYNTSVEYYVKRGFSNDEAKEKRKERQAVGRLDKFIERYGEEEGRKRWEERQKRWQKTLQNKSPEEKERINKLKGITLENMIRKWGPIDGAERYNNWLLSREKSKFFSKSSQDLFNKILSYIEDKENVKFATHNGEKIIQRLKHSYLYDFCYKNKIIEFNGDAWHANPKLYMKDDKPNPFSDLSANDLWQIDKNKQNIAKSLGYEILVIWESDYYKMPKVILNKCLIFLEIK